MEDIILNEAKKDYHRPMHSAEHILNQTMVRMFGCSRSINAHIEKKKSKCDYYLPESPSEEQVIEIHYTVGTDTLTSQFDVNNSNHYKKLAPKPIMDMDNMGMNDVVDDLPF